MQPEQPHRLTFVRHPCPYSRHRRIVVAYRLRSLGSVYSLLQVTPFVKNNIQLFFTALTKNMFEMRAWHSLTSFLAFSVTRFTKKPHRDFFACLPRMTGRVSLRMTRRYYPLSVVTKPNIFPDLLYFAPNYATMKPERRWRHENQY